MKPTNVTKRIVGSLLDVTIILLFLKLTVRQWKGGEDRRQSTSVVAFTVRIFFLSRGKK